MTLPAASRRDDPSEKFIFLRPSSTWFWMYQLIGATWLYHVQCVWFEWQSLQERSRSFAIWGGTSWSASSAKRSGVVGFWSRGPANCIVPMAAASIRGSLHFN